MLYVDMSDASSVGFSIFLCRCLKTINSKKYGVDLVCFTSHPTTVIYSSKNGWDGESKFAFQLFALTWSGCLEAHTDFPKWFRISAASFFE